MDAADTAAPETRYCGRSQALLYNEERLHSATGNETPIELVVRLAARGPR